MSCTGPPGSGGRRATVHAQGRDDILGAAHSDHDLVVFLEDAEINDPDSIRDDPEWVEWRGGRAHDWNTA
ncbi:hypothetical protein ABZ820_36720 [Streptomyces diacarni]|uniref:hypothetical protein n=1 Tax=Streptomyces diacarni TaxID=2800381 RepID=UPI0033D5DC51